MDPSSSSKPTSEPPTWELEHSSHQELETINQVELPLDQNRPNDVILRNIDQILMEDDDIEPNIVLQESSDFRAKEKAFYEAIDLKYPPSVQQESSSFQYADDDDDIANNTMGEVIKEKISHSEAMDDFVPIQEFDGSVLLYKVDEELAANMENMEIMVSHINQHQPGKAKTRTKRKPNNRGKDDQLVDLRALLTNCSKLVSSGEHVAANDFLRQIRHHSCHYGDGNQRLAHYFANGLEARLAGTGSKTQQDTSDYLRAYRASRLSSPLRKITSFASNETIITKSEKATTIHIIDFGMLYGIQWPSFIRRVAGRKGGPPKKVRITGIDFPQVAEIIEETGCRLARYAKMLGVPFEYKAIAQEWGTIKTEDLKIEEDEFVAVVSTLRSMILQDETVREAEKSPRDMFFELVREINPGVFIHSIMNGAFNQPLFEYRFRDLLLHYLAMFDMLDTLIPREKAGRMMMERDLFGKDILNVIACEGRERVKRPETYRQWQVRHLDAGFTKVAFERELMEAIIWKVKNSFHKDLSIFEDNQWLVMCWKGRTLFATSCWQ